MSEPPILTVFGSSKPLPGDQAYGQGEQLGRLAARAGWLVATGGYGGTMEAVSKGAAEEGGTAIGVTCQQIEDWRPLGPNQWVTEEIRVPTLRERLERLVDLNDAAIALPGGIGTLAEVALSWSWLQTAVINQKPLILVGAGWRQVFSQLHQSFGEYIDPQYVDLVGFAKEVEGAWQMVLEATADAGN